MKKSNVVTIIVALISLCGVIGAAIIGLASPFSEKIAEQLGGSGKTSLAVRVADSNGQAIQGAKVIFFSSNGSLSQYTDTNGTSVFNQISEKKGRLIVEAQNYQIYEKQLQSIKDSVDVRLTERSPDNVDFILRAVRADDGHPVQNIEMILFASGAVYHQITDSDGFANYTLPVSNGSSSVNAQISVNAKDYVIENQIVTLVAGRLQYVMLTPDSLTVEIPNIPTPTADTSSNTLPSSDENGALELDIDTIIGTGIINTRLAGNGLRVEMLGPDGSPWEQAYVEIYQQQPDAIGNPSLGDRVASGRINKQGQLDFDIASGTYAVCPAESPGYGWASDDDKCIYNVDVVSEQLTVVRLQAGRLEVAISDASGTPWSNVYFEICTQKQDANGHPVTDNCTGIRTDNAGIGWAWRTPGLYIVKLDLRGYNWGHLIESNGDANVLVERGKTTLITISMGQMQIGLVKPSGEPNANKYLEIYKQTIAANGEPTLGERVWGGRTDNGGYVTVGLTEGEYALRVDDNVLYSIPIEWGKITYSDGNTYEQK